MDSLLVGEEIHIDGAELRRGAHPHREITCRAEVITRAGSDMKRVCNFRAVEKNVHLMRSAAALVGLDRNPKLMKRCQIGNWQDVQRAFVLKWINCSGRDGSVSAVHIQAGCSEGRVGAIRS